METFDIETFRPRSFQVFPANQKTGGGASMTLPGPEADWSGGGWWVGVMKSFRLNEHTIFDWRALMMRLRSGLDEFIVPLIDAIPDYVKGTDFYSGSAPNRGTSLYIAGEVEQTLKRGLYFTIVHPNAGPRLYCIYEAGPMAGGQQLCRFGPPLREAVTAMTEIDFVNPRLVCKITSPPDENWPDIEPPFNARPSLSVIESFKYLEVVSP